MISYCNITGLKVEEKPEWQYYSSSTNYKQLLRIVDDNIIIIDLYGFVAGQNYIKGMEILEIFLKDKFENKKYYFLFNYTELLGSTLKVRANFTNWVLERIDQMHIVAFYGVNLSSKMYINAGKVLSKKFSKVHITTDYKSTIKFILDDKNKRKIVFDNLIKKQTFSSSKDYSIEIVKNDDFWDISLSGKMDNNLIIDLLNFIKAHKKYLSTDIYILCNSNNLVFNDYTEILNLSEGKKLGELSLIYNNNLNEDLIQALSCFLNISIFTTKEKIYNYFTNLSRIKSNIQTSVFDKLWLNKKQYFSYNNLNYKLVEEEDWKEELRDGKLRFETKIIDGNIYVRSVKGYLRKGDLNEMIKSINKIFLMSKTEYQKYYLILDFKDLIGASLSSRKEALEWFIHIADETKAIVFCNLNLNLKTIINYGKSKSKKFNHVYIVDDFNDAFNLVIRLKTNKPAIIQKEKRKRYLFNGRKIAKLEKENLKLKQAINNEVKEVTETIGQISWEEFYKPIELKTNEKNIFSDLYYALNLLQADIKEIITRREELTIKATESETLKTAFLANISHEIRTPLNGIIGFSELLAESEFISDKDIKYLKIINQNGNHLLKLINNIIDISKIEIGNLSITKNNVDINSMIINIAESIYTENEELTVNAICKKDEKFIIITDELRLNQVLTNLINNAIKFTTEGSVNIGYKVVDNNFVEFKVSDTGIGMTQKEINIAFDRFRQADDKTSYKYGGTGLGLYISKRIIELMGGEIWVESKKDVCSDFYFTIPLLT